MTVHIHAGGTLQTLCGQPLMAWDTTWNAPEVADCVPCAAHFGRRVRQFGPEWVAHATSGGTVLDGNLLVGK